MKDEVPKASCPVQTVIRVIGGKWKVRVLFVLIERVHRFSELRRAIPEVTQRMLTLQLRELESDGIVHREVYPEVPPKVEYSLTELGQTLVPHLKALRQWGVEYLQKQ